MKLSSSTNNSWKHIVIYKRAVSQINRRTTFTSYWLYCRRYYYNCCCCRYWLLIEGLWGQYHKGDDADDQHEAIDNYNSKKTQMRVFNMRKECVSRLPYPRLNKIAFATEWKFIVPMITAQDNRAGWGSPLTQKELTRAQQHQSCCIIEESKHWLVGVY